MAGFVVKNNAESLVADNPLASGATTLNVTSGEGDNFPSTFPYRLTIWDDEAHADPTDDSGMEIVECTGRSGDALTIVRAKEGTSDVDHANGERVAMLITAGLFNDSVQGIQSQIDKHLEIIRQMHPNVSVLAAMDEATYNAIYKDGDNYLLGSIPLTQESSDGETYIYEGNYEAQTFTPDTDAATLTSIDLLLHTFNGNPPQDDLYVDLYATDSSGHPTGSSLASGTLPSFGNAANAWHNITISYSVQKDVKYALVFSSPSTNGQNNSYCLQDNSGGGISNGNRESSTDSGSTWTTETEDYAIKINNVAGALTGDITSDAFAANADVLSFYSHLKGKFSNGGSTASDPVEVEIYGNGDSYASPLNGATKLKIDPSDPIIELYRIDDTVVAKSDAQTDWVLDDNATNGAFPAKTTSTHETILAEEIGCASVVMVEKSVNGDFTDAEILIEDDDYTVDYSTRTATKIILTTSAASDIVNSQSKLRITWIVDAENIDGTANTVLKMKIYLSRTDTTEASPEIQPIDLGTSQYAEMKYMCG